MLSQPQERRSLDVRPGSGGDVVDDDRQAALVRYSAIVRFQHPLIGSVVVRRHHERRVGAELGCPSGGRDRRGRVIRARAGDHGHARTRGPLGDGLHGQRDDPVALGLGERR